MKTHRKGFSLVELLVVIAIISILLAILMPVLARVLTKVKEELLSSNIEVRTEPNTQICSPHSLRKQPLVQRAKITIV